MRTKIELENEKLGLIAESKGRWWTVRQNGNVIVDNASRDVAIHEYFAIVKAAKENA